MDIRSLASKLMLELSYDLKVRSDLDSYFNTFLEQVFSKSVKDKTFVSVQTFSLNNFTLFGFWEEDQPQNSGKIFIPNDNIGYFKSKNDMKSADLELADLNIRVEDLLLLSGFRQMAKATDYNCARKKCPYLINYLDEVESDFKKMEFRAPY